MTGKTFIEINENNLDYYRQEKIKIDKIKNIEIILITFFFLAISVIVAFLQYYEYRPLSEITTFKRIKHNMGNWKNNIIEKTGIESNRGKRIALQINNNAIYSFQPYDFGSYYAAMRINNVTYLPEFIKRGNGDVWKVNKAATVDVSAQQFTRYLILNYSNNYLTCGIDMYNILGYGGYFNSNHPCQSALDILVNEIT